MGSFPSTKQISIRTVLMLAAFAIGALAVTPFAPAQSDRQAAAAAATIQVKGDDSGQGRGVLLQALVKDRKTRQGDVRLQEHRPRVARFQDRRQEDASDRSREDGEARRHAQKGQVPLPLHRARTCCCGHERSLHSSLSKRRRAAPRARGGRTSCGEVRHAERQQHEHRRDGDDECKDDAHEECRRCGALAFVDDLAHVRSLLLCRPNGMASEALVLRHVPRRIVLHVPNDVAWRRPRLRCQHPTPLPVSRDCATAVGGTV